ncbi:protein serine/threonine phosphatase 2C family protein [Phanerochaete sordida]|uniref:Protein serine/threonine phosphatase 2C family protein n=1 Tax=Phanerochaete sordida TaxID=48140 RepID=A0A9P3LB29_9APHY|nr:protein serine/threonine phosphatase 2C family protein [Phanerochaete sordida]
MYRSFARSWSRTRRRLPPSRGFATVATFAGLAGPAYYFSTKGRIHLDTNANEEPSRNISVTVAYPPDGLSEDEFKLRQWEYSAEYNHDILQICRWDFNTIPSDISPDEQSAFRLWHTDKDQWTYFGIFDGLIGPDTSYWLYNELMPTIARNIGDIYTSMKHAATELPCVSQIEQAFKDAFEAVDTALVHGTAQTALTTPIRDDAVLALAPAYSGSCATVTSYNARTRLLHLGHVGHSRAVLGRRVARSDGHGRYIYEARQLTTDHISLATAEEPRPCAQSPGERVVQGDQRPELSVSRAFGLGRYKWSTDMQKQLAEKRLLNLPLDEPQPPSPVLTATPDTSTIKTEPGDFLIVASEGLWNLLTSGEAVGLVGWWLESRDFDPHGSWRNTRRQPQLPHDLPVAPDSHRTIPRSRSPDMEPRFVDMDENVATHLLRNALGGADRRRFLSFMNIEHEEHPAVRRDDLSIFVIFFS